jgi:hypothetical protein
MVMTLVIRWPLVPAEHLLSDDFRSLGLFVRTIRFADRAPTPGTEHAPRSE